MTMQELDRVHDAELDAMHLTGREPRSQWPRRAVYINVWTGERHACVVLGESPLLGHLGYRLRMRDGRVWIAEKSFVDLEG